MESSCEGTRWVLLDAATGEEKEEHPKDCHVGFRQEVTEPEQMPPDWKGNPDEKTMYQKIGL